MSSKDLQDLDDKWAEHLAYFEALLIRGKIISTPKVPEPGSFAKKPPVSDKPFLEPNTALATGLVMLMAIPRDHKSGEKSKHKKDKHDKKDSRSSKQSRIRVPILVQ